MVQARRAAQPARLSAGRWASPAGAQPRWHRTDHVRWSAQRQHTGAHPPLFIGSPRPRSGAALDGTVAVTAQLGVRCQCARGQQAATARQPVLGYAFHMLIYSVCWHLPKCHLPGHLKAIYLITHFWCLCLMVLPCPAITLLIQRLICLMKSRSQFEHFKVIVTF